MLATETKRFTDRLFGNTLIRFCFWVAVLGFVFPGIFSDAYTLAEWMDDPLGTNQTPPWGNVGQVPAGTCQTNWEAGDPLSGPLMPAITMSGYPYHKRELSYFSFFFNSSSTQSVGAYNSWPAFPHGLPQGGLMGGAFSSNASYGGPANACPNGGVAPFTFLPAPQGGTPAFHP